MKKQICFLLVILFIFIAQGAGAHCAWVLWQSNQYIPVIPGENDKIFILEVFDDKKSCLQGLSNEINHLLAEQEKSTDVNAKIKYLTKGTGGYFSLTTINTKGKYLSIKWTYRCLPDTVDPRGR